MKKDILNFPIALLKVDGKHRDAWHDLKGWLDDVLNFVIYQNYKQEKYNAEAYRKAAEDFNIEFVNIKAAYDNGRKLSQYRNGRDVYTRMNLTTFWDFYTNEKTEYDVACLLAYLALCSIIGNLNDVNYSRTNFAMMFARMSGYKSPKEAGCTISENVKYYDVEYRRNKLINTLRLDWGLNYYAARGIRGFYVSFDSLEIIVKEAEQRRRSRRLKEINRATTAIRQKVLKELNSPP